MSPLRSHLCTTAALAIMAIALTGCQSKQDKAIETAKQQAIATGQPQQVIAVDKDGNTVTTVVQPPAPGQSQPVITTTTTPAAPGQQTASSNNPPPPGSVGNATPAAPGQSAAPVPGGAPVIRPLDVTVPAGTPLSIRINQHISVKTSRPGDRFDGELADSVTNDNGNVLVPKGTPVAGVVTAAHRRGHFKGASILQLRLTSMTFDGKSYRLRTGSLTRTKKGKGKRTAGWIGGTTGAGMLIGGIATGGVGLLVGGLSGAGAGTLIAGTTGNRDIEIPAESIVRFRLAEDLTVQPQ